MRRDPVFTGIFPGHGSGEEVLITSLKQLAAGIYKHPQFSMLFRMYCRIKVTENDIQFSKIVQVF